MEESLSKGFAAISEHLRHAQSDPQARTQKKPPLRVAVRVIGEPQTRAQQIGPKRTSHVTLPAKHSEKDTWPMEDTWAILMTREVIVMSRPETHATQLEASP